MDLQALHELEDVFKALANINRLKLLVALQTPRGYSEIELTPSRASGDRSTQRPISRQAVRNHIEELREIGVVVETDDDARKRRFVVDRSRLFAVVDRMRNLATVEPSQVPDGPTMEMQAESRGRTPNTPHLALVRGVEEGRVFELDDSDGRHVIGRSPDTDVSLDYDGFVSSEHATVHREEGDFFLQDLPQNKNGTFLNWSRMKEGAVAPLSPGDIVGVGRSLLVFRA